jgi:hypothetical protein
MSILNLNERNEDDPSEPSRPQLRLVRPGPHVVFRRPEDPEVPWMVRIAGYFVGIVITGIVVVGVLLLGALLREVYHRVDEATEREARAKTKSGAIQLTLPRKQEPQPAPQQAPRPAKP